MNASWRGWAGRLLQREVDGEAGAWAEELLATFDRSHASRGNDAAAWPELETAEQLAVALRWLAPSALLQWGWLRSVGHAADGHRALNAGLMAAYLDAVGLDEPAQALAAQYRALALAAGVSLPPLATLAEMDEVSDPAWLGVCTGLALACFPGSRRGALLGYTLAHCRYAGSGLDWLERQLQRHGLPLGYVRRHRRLLERHCEALQGLAMEADAPSDRELTLGAALYDWVQQASAVGLKAALAVGPNERVAVLLEKKARYAIGYHSKVELQGKSPDEWLREGDWPALRTALRALPLGGQRDMFKAMEFGKAMFGVFGPEEQALLREWLGMPDVDGATRQGQNAASVAVMAEISLPLPVAEASRKPPSARELYYRLLNRETYPEIRPAAARYAEKILARTHWLMPFQPGLRRWLPYSPEAFRDRVDTVYLREMARYRPLSGPPRLSRELCLWGIEQLAPAILVDGCWLENAAGAEPAADEVRRRLLRIFADEVGAGSTRWNHPNVYRRLLESLNLQLPAHDSAEFARHVRLSDTAFPLPAYLLAMGAWPQRFFPELLGLNLAIELSGLGAGYLGMVDTLRRYGIDPTIVQLHLSIDNLASGHAALAREAIELHLAELAGQGGDVAGQWRRVWTGYCSLHVAALPFAFAGWRRWLRERWSIASGL